MTITPEDEILLVDVPESVAQALTRQLGSRPVRVLDPALLPPAADGAPSAPTGVLVVGLPDEDDLTRAVRGATLGLWRLWQELRPRLLVLLSSTDVFDGYPEGWAITESWSPKPTDQTRGLAAVLAETLTREVCRVRGTAVVLRTDRLAVGDQPPGPDEISAQEVADVIARVLARAESTLEAPWPSWQVMHVVSGAGRFPLGTLGPLLGWEPSERIRSAPAPFVADGATGPTPASPPLDPQWRRPLTGLPTPEAVTVFGGGGPLGVAATAALAARHTLLVTDARPLATIAAAPAQNVGAPLPTALSTPHSERVVDITDLDEVMRAAQGADALVNCSVVRTGVTTAFEVNVIGALNVMLAARDNGIRTVVHTGPAMGLLPHPVGTYEDAFIRADAPYRAGDNLYFLTKLLGRRLVGILAEEWRIAAPVLLFNKLLDPASPTDHRWPSFSVSWADAGAAVAAAVEVTSLDHASPSLLVMAPGPHGNYDHGETERVLGWRARDDLRPIWHRR